MLTPRRWFHRLGVARIGSLALSAVATALLALAPPVQAAEREPLVRTDVPATGTNLHVRPINNSPTLAADPTEDRFVVLANRLDGPEFGCALALSGDRGGHWVPADPVPELPPGTERCYGPEVAFDKQGTLYYLFIGLHGLGNEPSGVFLTTSNDRGRTFTKPRQVLGTGNFQVRMALDRDMGQRGRIHIVWLSVGGPTPTGGLPLSRNPILAAHSDDGGTTFSAPVQVSDADRRLVVAPAITLGADGAVHIAYYDLGQDFRDYQGLEGPTWDGRWSLVAARSTDRGGRFGRGAVIDDEVVPPGRVILIYTMAPPAFVADRSGRVYAAWADARMGDPDIFLSASGDGGRGFAEPRRLNDDPAGNGAHQYLPQLGVAPNGRVDAIFYDRRNDRQNFLTDVYYTSSENAGQRFGPGRRINTESSDSRLGMRYNPVIRSARGLVEYGNRLGLLSRADSVVAAWADIRNWRSQDVFTAEVVLARQGSSLARRVLPPGLIGAAVLALIVAAGIARRRRQSLRSETDAQLDTSASVQDASRENSSPP